jgi:hypothetical protein
MSRHSGETARLAQWEARMQHLQEQADRIEALLLRVLEALSHATNAQQWRIVHESAATARQMYETAQNLYRVAGHKHQGWDQKA